MPSREDQILEAAIAEEAGAGYSALRERPGADDLGRRADRLSHEYILEALTNACPGDAVLSEEGPDDHARLSADRVWIVDPLDGTREYVEPGRTDWAVHIALWERWTIERSGPTRVPDHVKGRPTPRIGCCRSDVMPASAGPAKRFSPFGATEPRSPVGQPVMRTTSRTCG